MKKGLQLLLVLFAVLSINCFSQNSGLQKVEYDITTSYLLIPVQEDSPDVKMNIYFSDDKNREVFYVRLAKNKIDYWVKLDVKKHKGQRVSLVFENTESSALGLSNIKASDRFEFEYNETYRPQFHFSPEYGWMNDPNGLVYLDGEYHLFYQYNPYGNKWGNMHWGHAVSTNLTSWTYLPVALGVDSLGDIFSGSALVDVNNTAGFGKNALIAIYTSNGKTQQQSIAYSTDKGRTFTKYAGNPVIPNPGITDFRDPKVSWNEQSKQWVMALATKQTITFYGSPDLKNWSKLSEFASESGAHGGVWECPDLFPLTYGGKTKWVLLVSINPGGPNGGSATQYFIGNFDGKTFTADNLPYPLWIDYGRDNYAGVTFCNIPQNDGRRIFIGWMNNWDYANDVPTKNFRSAMTVPRELKLKNNGTHLIVTNLPVREIERLRCLTKSIKNLNIKHEKRLDSFFAGLQNRFELEMTITPKSSEICGFGLTNAAGDSLNFTFDLEQNVLKFDRRNCGLNNFSANFASVSSVPLTLHTTYRIRLLIDRASAELFINEGETVLTNIIFPKQIFSQLIFFTSGKSLKAYKINLYNLK